MTISSRLKREATRMKKRRQELKDGIEKICSENEAASNLLKSFNRNVTGRPRTETDQPEYNYCYLTLLLP